VSMQGPGVREASTAGRQLIQFLGNNFGPEGSLSGFVSYGHPNYVKSTSDNCGQCSEHGVCVNSTSVNAYSCGKDGCTCICDQGFFGEKCDKCKNVGDYECDERTNKIFKIQDTAGGFDMRGLECRVTTAHKQIRCLTSSGTGRDHYFVVHVEGQTSLPVFGNNSYAVPVVETYSGSGVHNARTSGGQIVVLNGRDFGSVERNKITWVKYGKINSDVQFNAQDCRVLVDHRKILCRTAQGVGKDLQWRVSIDNQESILSTTNYGAPQLKEIQGITTMFTAEDTRMDSNVYANTDGGDEVTLLGSNFGPPQLQDKIFVAVTYGPTGAEYNCVDAVVRSHSTITCVMVAGVGKKIALENICT
jgi:hypothetical protein